VTLSLIGIKNVTFGVSNLNTQTHTLSHAMYSSLTSMCTSLHYTPSTPLTYLSHSLSVSLLPSPTHSHAPYSSPSSLSRSVLEAESLCQHYGTELVAEIDRMRVLESLRVGVLFLSHLCIDGFSGDLSGGKGKCLTD
jgi:hypothetical protein